jgi:hypothetical protein
MRCDCGANMVRRWTRRTTGKAEGLAGRGAAVDEDTSAAGRSGRADSLKLAASLRAAPVGARDGGDDGAGRRAAIRRGGRGRFRPVRTVARSDDGTPGQVCGFLVTLGYSRYAFLWLRLRQQRLEQVGFEETATFEQIRVGQPGQLRSRPRPRALQPALAGQQ